MKLFLKRLTSINSWLIVLITIATFTTVSCSDQTIHSGALTLSSSPNSLSEDFPSDLIYENSKIKTYGMLDTGGFWSPAQYAILAESNDESNNIITHYLTTLQKQNWQILQSRYFEKDKKTVLVAESLFKQTVTIVVVDQNPTTIKLFLKRSSDE